MSFLVLFLVFAMVQVFAEGPPFNMVNWQILPFSQVEPPNYVLNENLLRSNNPNEKWDEKLADDHERWLVMSMGDVILRYVGSKMNKEEIDWFYLPAFSQNGMTCGNGRAGGLSPIKRTSPYPNVLFRPNMVTFWSYVEIWDYTIEYYNCHIGQDSGINITAKIPTLRIFWQISLMRYDTKCVARNDKFEPVNVESINVLVSHVDTKVKLAPDMNFIRKSLFPRYDKLIRNKINENFRNFSENSVGEVNLLCIVLRI